MAKTAKEWLEEIPDRNSTWLEEYFKTGTNPSEIPELMVLKEAMSQAFREGYMLAREDAAKLLTSGTFLNPNGEMKFYSEFLARHVREMPVKERAE